MIFRRWQDRIDDAFEDGHATGMQMGYLIAEGRWKGLIAQLDNGEDILAQLEEMDDQALYDDEPIADFDEEDDD